jgi:tetratricopeptide (TPR) repeat protein
MRSTNTVVSSLHFIHFASVWDSIRFDACTGVALDWFPTVACQRRIFFRMMIHRQSRSGIWCATWLGNAMLVSGLLTCVGATATAQNPNLKRMQQQQKEFQKRLEQQRREAMANQPDLPSDPQLLSLHREFISKAEKLAGEYERKKQYEEAREVYEAMIRLVPKYADAEAALDRILKMQTMKDRKITEVQAADGWQDTGAVLIDGMPVRMEVRGTWTVVLETGPAGVEIPNEMKPRDSRINLGTLIAAIANSPSELEEAKPFVVRPGEDFVAKKSGRLFLRMFDIDPSDNAGKLLVLIQSTFGK